ncbi:MAG: hypothetical protein Q8P18_17280 [Pseudomonadota bacterium]|nr:hypothetical protein [Pseudomonadota bacterium]
MTRRRWVAPLLFLFLAVAWTWPAAIAGRDALAVRHFDGIGVVWMIDAGARLYPDMTDTLTGWPDGAEYHRPESWLLVLLSPLLRLAAGPLAFNLLQILGLAASATAAEAFARRLGARAPWSFIGGVAFAFNGIAATALLEGHIYHVIDPWLPLFGIAWLDATGRNGRPRDGLLAGAWFVLTGLTTAYLGIGAGILALGLAIPALLGRHRARALLAMLPALLPVLPFVAWYVYGYSQGSYNANLVTDLTPAEVAGAVQVGSASLVSLAGAAPEVDRGGHSIAATLSATVLALCLVSPWVLGFGAGSRPFGWRRVLGVGAVALVLSLGPRLALDALHPTLPLPFSALLELPGAGYLRFPLRLGWVWALCGGAVASCVAQALATRIPATAAVLGFVVFEAFFIVGMPFRQMTQIGTVPSAYGASSGPVLDLYPVSEEEGDDLNSWSRGWACYYQTVHQRPIADHCQETTWARNPRAAVADPLTALLLARDIAAVRSLLGAEGFVTVALHPDFYSPADRAALTEALTTLDPAPRSSTDGGELVVAYAVGGVP